MMRSIKLIGSLAAILLLLSGTTQAETKKSKVKPILADPRGQTELTVCSQNLGNYGLYLDSKARSGISRENYKIKEDALIKRFTSAKCDIIAVQEIVSKNEVKGLEVLKQLSGLLEAATGRVFATYVGSSNDPSIRNGFLVSKQRAEVLNTLSYSNVELPKISPKQKPRFFSRSPFEIQVSVKSQEDGKPKNIAIVNMHSKSKSGAKGDPTGLEWETYRMEMAEALRRILESRHSSAFSASNNILIVLGDRNSDFDTASARILSGIVTLNNFSENGGCRLSKRGVPLCQAGTSAPQSLFSVLTEDPQTKLIPGTYRYKNTYSWIDDILMPAESLRYALEAYDMPGDYDSGVYSQPKEASDHAMIYVKLNW